MTDIKQYIDEHDLTVEDVIDGLDIDVSQFADVPDEPHDFYDGEPAVEDLREDFDAVDLLADEKDQLADTVDDLREEVREAQRPVFEEKASELAEMTDKWGDEDDILARFDADDDNEQWTVEDVTDKIELVEDIVSNTTTTVADSGDEGSEVETSLDIDRTDRGGFDLRSRTKVE